jgi:hypothetical protein
MYIKPNTTAEVVCPYTGNQTAPITWRNSNTLFVVRDTVGDGEGEDTKHRDELRCPGRARSYLFRKSLQ